MPVKKPLAVFTRDGQSREAYTAGERTALRASGWVEATPATPQSDPVSDPEPKPKRSHKKKVTQ